MLVPIDYRASADFLQRVADIVDARAILVGDAVDATAGEPDAPVWQLSALDRQRRGAAGRRRRRSSMTPDDVAESSSPRARPRSRRAW